MTMKEWYDMFVEAAYVWADLYDELFADWEVDMDDTANAVQQPVT